MSFQKSSVLAELRQSPILLLSGVSKMQTCRPPRAALSSAAGAARRGTEGLSSPVCPSSPPEHQAEETLVLSPRHPGARLPQPAKGGRGQQ